MIKKKHFKKIAQDLRFDSSDLDDPESAVSIVYNSEFVRNGKKYDCSKLLLIGWLLCSHVDTDS